MDLKMSSLSASSTTSSLLNLMPSSSFSSSLKLVRLLPLLSLHPKVSSSSRRKLNLVLCSSEQPSMYFSALPSINPELQLSQQLLNPPDFTRMESFGEVEAFAVQRPPGVAAKLIDCKSSKGLYYIEYALQNPGEGRKHLYTAPGMAFHGWYNRLYNISGQFVDEESQAYGSKNQKVVSSFIFT